MRDPSVRGRYVVSCRDPGRARIWREVWGTEFLPVLYLEPRGEPPCFLVDTKRFDAETIARALVHAAKTFKLASTAEAAAELEKYGGYPILAAGVNVYEDLR